MTVRGTAKYCQGISQSSSPDNIIKIFFHPTLEPSEMEETLILKIHVCYSIGPGKFMQSCRKTFLQSFKTRVLKL